MKLELFYFDQCPFCQMVLQVIKQLDLTEQITFCNTMQDQSYAQRLIQVTGKRTVPCLFIDEDPMFESSDIISWLQQNSDRIKQA